MSDEINNYLLYEQKGEILNLLLDDEVKEIVIKNAPIKTIKEIKLIEEDDGNI